MILDEKFNNQEFGDWVEEFLPGFSRDVRKVDVLKSFSGVKLIHTLGESSLGVRVYTIEMDTDPSRRKVGLATDSFSLLRNYGTPNAIVVYFSEDSSQWRLSLLTSTPVWTDGKIITKLSNPKRQSYVLGPKAKVKTPHQYLVTKGAVTDFTDLKSRFSLEVVNKEFYKEISQAFIRLVGGTLSNGRSKQTFKPLLKLPFVTDHSQTSLEFAVRLIGRIIFCWFLREKRSASGNTLMPRELLSSEASNSTEDYYHRILEPIFFEILNKPIKSRKEAYSNELFSAIPYLNGGLFSPHEDDFYNYNDGKQAINHNMVSVPDNWLRSLLGVLETYNFTIDENTSFDEELSIDPEMLGRIFENLLAEINPETGESARKSTGSYYTPRVIVDYMVDESLKLYLKSKTNVNEEKLKSLISYDLEDDETNPLNNEEKDKIADALGKIKILDPACGSGAFPIGSLQKIVFILQQIDQNGQLWFKKQIQKTPVELRRVIEREFQEKNFDYIRKLGIIRENIYGIDIQPIATEISRLRCFLTLVVDERVDDTLENRGIEPLPNLDFKFVTANTLVGLPKINLDQQELFDNTSKIDHLKSLRDQYFTARNEERKDVMLAFSDLQSEMINDLIDKHSFTGVLKAELTRKLTDWKPFKHKSTDWFDPEWMFGIKDGFDIVIANPPYIQLSKNNITKNYKDYLKETYKTSSGRFNTFGFFILLALKIAKTKGVITYIVPNTLLTQEYYQYIRKYMLDHSYINEIVNFDDMVFESAVVENITFFLTKKELSDTSNHNIRITNQTDNEIHLNKTVVQANLNTTYKNQFDVKGDSITTKIDSFKNTTFLSEICNINQAIALKNDRRKSLINDPSEGKEVYKLLDGRNINRFSINWSGVYLNYDIKKIHSCRRKDIFLVDEKLLFRRVSSKLIFAYDNQQFFALNTLVVVTIKEGLSTKYKLKYLLGILNSSVVNYYYFHKYKSTKNVFSEIQARSVGRIPIPLANDNEQDKIVGLVDKQLVSPNPETDKEIDEIILKLYDLSKEDMELLNDN